MSYSNYNSTMMGTQIDTITVPTNTTTNTTSSGSLYWGLNGTSASPGPSTNWDNITLAEPNIKGATLKVKGDADFEGEVTIKGKSLSEMFDKIEERLAILHPNPELEDRWDELKELGKRYKELEQELIEKEKVWAILKK